MDRAAIRSVHVHISFDGARSHPPRELTKGHCIYQNNDRHDIY